MNQSIDYEITENGMSYSQSRKKRRSEGGYSPGPPENMVTQAQMEQLVRIQDIDQNTKDTLLEAIGQVYLAHEITVLHNKQQAQELQEQQQELDRMAQVHDQYKKIIQKLQEDLEATHENQLHLIQQFNAKKKEYKQDLHSLEEDFLRTRVVNERLGQEGETMESIRRELGVRPEQDILKVVRRYNRFNNKIKQLILSLVPEHYFQGRSPNFKDLWEVLNRTLAGYVEVLQKQEEQKEKERGGKGREEQNGQGGQVQRQQNGQGGQVYRCG